MTEIRKATKQDLQSIYEIYEKARTYMRIHGNPDQWGNDYPPEELTKEDLDKERLFVITEESTIEAVFVFYSGVEEAYDNIKGSWTYNLPYLRRCTQSRILGKNKKHHESNIRLLLQHYRLHQNRHPRGQHHNAVGPPEKRLQTLWYNFL